MLLPSALIRSELRLDTPAKRFIWAAEQLYGALFPSSIVVADIATAVPAKTANAGIVPATAANMFFEMLRETKLDHFSDTTVIRLYLPFDYAQHYRGVPMLYCVNPVVAAPYHPTATPVRAGTPILDNSPCKTFEQYLVEQLSYMIVGKPTYSTDLSSLEVLAKSWGISDYQERITPIINVRSTVLRTGLPGVNRYENITEIA